MVSKYTEDEINELEEKNLFQEIEINELKNKIRMHEFEKYKSHEIQAFAKIASWELNHLSYEVAFSQDMESLLKSSASFPLPKVWNDFLDLLIDRDSHVNIKDLLYNNVIQNKEELVIEHNLKTFENELLVVRHYFKTFYNTLGHPLTTIGLIMDITEQIKNREIMYQQSKIASIGEMLGNIAHQWRQPLSVISACASGTKINKELGLLEDKELFRNMDIINDTAQDLSKTIDDFRNFYAADVYQEFNINIIDTMEKVLSLIIDSYKSSNITIIKNFQEGNYLVRCNENLFIQALINIFNNANDAFISESINDNKIVLITLENINNQICLEIKDNAGGIKKEIIDKIFEPYFTTKHASQGTGIGLYMTYQIITKRMKSKISVENIAWSYKDEEFNGASFKIIIDNK